MNKRQLTFKEAVREALEEELIKNQNLVLLGDVARRRQPPQVGFDTTLAGFEKKFPNRVIVDLPLIEDILVGIGMGASIGGLKAVVSVDHATLVTLAVDDIYRLGIWRYRMAETKGPSVVIRLGHEIFIGRGPEFSASLLSLLFHLPNIWIATPSTPYHAKGLLKTAINSNQSVVFWEHKNIYDVTGQVPEEEYQTPFGITTKLRSGKHITVIAWSYMVHLSLAAAELLVENQCDAEIIALQTLNPMDLDPIIASVEKTGKAIIVEEDMLRGGIGAEISARISEIIPECLIRRVASRNVPLPEGQKYEKIILPSIESIIKACLALMGK